MSTCTPSSSFRPSACLPTRRLNISSSSVVRSRLQADGPDGGAVFAALTVLYSLLFLAELVRYHRTLARWKRGEIGAGSVKNKGPAIVGFGGEKSGEEEGGLARKGEKG